MKLSSCVRCGQVGHYGYEALVDDCHHKICWPCIGRLVHEHVESSHLECKPKSLVGLCTDRSFYGCKEESVASIACPECGEIIARCDKHGGRVKMMQSLSGHMGAHHPGQKGWRDKLPPLTNVD